MGQPALLPSPGGQYEMPHRDWQPRCGQEAVCASDVCRLRRSVARHTACRCGLRRLLGTGCVLRMTDGGQLAGWQGAGWQARMLLACFSKGDGARRSSSPWAAG